MKKLKISLPPFFQFSESRMKTDDNPAGMEKMPVLFIGHGSPMNIVLKNRFTRSLADLGASLPRPAAIMVISAHWLTRGSFVTCIDRPRMIYDFYGFPEELYRVKYGCTGAPLLAKYVTESGAGLSGATMHGGSTTPPTRSSCTCFLRQISRSSR